MEYFVKVLKNYATFTGRARRKEYWMFALFNAIISIALTILGKIINMAIGSGGEFLNTIYTLAILVPALAVGVRRMHDVGKSGWFLLIPIYNLILACTEGTKGSNQYGPDPKATASGDSLQELPKMI